jgi:hypothetical protein
MPAPFEIDSTRAALIGKKAVKKRKYRRSASYISPACTIVSVVQEDGVWTIVMKSPISDKEIFVPETIFDVLWEVVS